MTDFIRDIINRTVKYDRVQSGFISENLGGGNYQVQMSSGRINTVRGPSQAYKNSNITTNNSAIINTNGTSYKEPVWYEV